MNALLRHTALRLWITAIAGGLACLALVPWWQSLVGMQWLVLPVSGIMTLCFMAAGWGMNRLGMIQVERRAKEAAVWERAGMRKEAEFALEHAVAVFDSFWLSPVMRRRRATWITRRLARFYLSHPRLGPKARDRIRAYLHLYPQDQSVAEGWLEHLLSLKNDQTEDHELTTRISEAQAGNAKVQMLLMQLFLFVRRVDFSALQTYRRVWQQQDDPPRDLVLNLAGILLEETLLSDWSLKVYLKAYALGATDCLEGLAAAERWLIPNAENRKDLAAAGQILSATPPDQIDTLIRRFAPPAGGHPAPHTQDHIAEAGRVFKTAAKTLSDTGTQLADSLRTRTVQSIHQLPRKLINLKDRLRHGSAGLRRGAVIAALALAAGVLAIAGWRAMDRSPETQTAAPPKEIKPEETISNDPFTIQVAAYSHSKDAGRLVDQLKQQGLDAFWTQASSSQRTWYQVKVSHFATKIQAQQFGEQLKAKGLIDDFYVANYKGAGKK